jgi:hypothetical protein
LFKTAASFFVRGCLEPPDLNLKDLRIVSRLKLFEVVERRWQKSSAFSLEKIISVLVTILFFRFVSCDVIVNALNAIRLSLVKREFLFDLLGMP